MAADAALVDWLREAPEPPGTVTKRTMTSGATPYRDGTISGIVGHDGLLWFRADGQSEAAWDAAECARFSYRAGERVGSFDYRRAPDACHDDADALREWAAMGVGAGLRAQPVTAKRKRA